jgi:glucose/arabinose dehydrogenase
MLAVVAAYSFDEGTGTTLGDSSGNLNHGTIANAAWTISGKYGNALSFNGLNSLITVADSASLDLTTAMTIEAWVRPTAIDDWETVLLKERPGGLAYALYGGNPGGPPASYITLSGGGGDVGAESTVALPLNAWSHLAATYDGATIRLYVNGNQVASQAAAGSITTSSSPLYIGGNAMWGEHFAGRIDEIRIYNTVLNASQIQQDMATPVNENPLDDVPPTVSVIVPGEGAALSHVAVITATAADNVGVANVEFFVDGESIGFDTVGPYTIHWNTTEVANGPHTITAIARDARGLETTSTAVHLTTLNPAFVNEVVVPGISDATTIAFLPDGRMLIGQLTNKILLVQAGASKPDPQPLIDLEYIYQWGEQGLMDLAVDPNFAANGYIYAYYTKGFPGQQNHNRLSRFTMSGNAIVSGSETVLWQDDAVVFHEHHGGAIAFGNDGKIYFTTGEQFVPAASQQLTNHWGKVLRINPNGTIPTDNPFYDGAGPNKDEIWAYGLRNPYRMSIDSVTGRMFIGDVGGNDASTAIEEINLGVAGANYGWPMGEGNSGVPGTTAPIYSYPHESRDSAVTAGFVYRGSQYPAEYYGSFFFADYARNTIRRLTFDAQGNVADVLDFLPADGSLDQPLPGDVVELIQGPDGMLYYVDIGFDGHYNPNAAAIRRIRYVAGNQPPVAIAVADDTEGLPPLTVHFSSAGSLDPEGVPLSYSWDFGDGTTSTAANPTHVYATAGPYVVSLRVSDGVSSILANQIELAVGTRPVPTIVGPVDGSYFRAGDVIAFSGTATDAEDAVLPASAYFWEIRFHHEGHVHPGGIVPGSQSGQLTIPTSGHDYQGHTSYEIVLTVTDSSGLSGTTSVTVYPELVDLSFNSLPAGLTILFDGISRQTPFVIEDLIGFHHVISAPDQVVGNQVYTLIGWSDGGAPTHEIVVPATNQNLVANFAAVPVALPGDYNNDGVADGADYVMWQKLLGSSTIMRNDVTPGDVGTVDCGVWVNHFGEPGAGQDGDAAIALAINDREGSAEWEGEAPAEPAPLVRTTFSINASASESAFHPKTRRAPAKRALALSASMESLPSDDLLLATSQSTSNRRLDFAVEFESRLFSEDGDQRDSSDTPREVLDAVFEELR